MLKAKSQSESYNNQDRNVGQVADREEKGWIRTGKMKRGVGNAMGKWKEADRATERDEGHKGRERVGKGEKNPRASSASGLLGTADSLRGYFKV